MLTIQSNQATHPEGICVINPLEEPSWDALLTSFQSTQFFHISAWARVLHDTYGHRPVYLCSRSAGSLPAALPLMEVASFWTGRRGVCLPFTDYCWPLESSLGSSGPLFARAMELGRERGWKYLEVRCPTDSWPGAQPSVAFHVHRVSLEGTEPELFSRLESATRRGIRKAENSGVEVRFETSPDAVRTFYRLHCQTRQRHGVPPQPFRFFENIQRHVLSAGHGFAVTALQQGTPIAASVFFHHGRQAIYKFGASDFHYQQSRPNNLILWSAIRHYAREGFDELHLGRTSLAAEGLRRFKLAFGANESRFEYRKYDFRSGRFVTDVDCAESWANHLFRLAPQWMLRWAGNTLYPHLS